VLRACLPKPGAVGGGTASFYQNLRSFLASAGIPFTDRLEDDWDVLFANSWGLSFRTALHAKRSHPAARLLHRVDGSALDYGREAIADLRQARVNLLADLTVFQSQYGKHATTRKYRVIRQDGPVIHNPVDVERFRPEGERVPLPGKVRVCAVTHSANPRKGAAVPRPARAGWFHREEQIMANKRLYVGNLPYEVSEQDLRSLFEPFGPVTDVQLIGGRGFGFVEVPEERAADAITRWLGELPHAANSGDVYATLV